MKYKDDYTGPIDHDDGECFCCNHYGYEQSPVCNHTDDKLVLYVHDNSMFMMIEREDDKD